ncbi:MAG TPA: carboxyltransferase domain-containing protein, partial [Gemmatimonadales bacterium]|nr:carboxyltransferase domain-containing protein [Gemmatimonadales bacterium]
MSPAPPVLPLGEAAWTVVLGNTVGREVHGRVTALAERIRDANLPSVIEILPAYAAVTVYFDPHIASPDSLRARLAELAA